MHTGFLDFDEDLIGANWWGGRGAIRLGRERIRKQVKRTLWDRLLFEDHVLDSAKDEGSIGSVVSHWGGDLKDGRN